MKTILQISTTDKDLRKYPDIFIEEIEQAVVLIWDDYKALEEIRHRLVSVEDAIKHRQGQIRYGHMPKYEPILDGGKVS